MRLRKRALVVLLASLFLVAGLHPSTAAAAGSGPWQIGIYQFPNCLEVQGGVKDSGAQVQLWDCDGTQLHRLWYMQEVQPRYWHIWNAKSGKCLNVKGASKNDGAKVIQYTCQGIGTHNDQWELIPTGHRGANGDLYFIQNRWSLKCLNAQGASTANGTDLIQYGCRWAWNTVFTWWR
jgi:hypothetical protein